MKIAFVTFEYPPFIMGGAGVYATNITQELGKLGHQITIFTPNSSEKVKNNQIKTHKNVKIVRVDVNKKIPFKALQFWIKLPKALKKENENEIFDLVHINGISYCFLRKKLLNVPNILTIHHIHKDTSSINNKFFSKIKDLNGETNYLLPLIEKRGVKSVNKIVAVSKFTKNQIVNYYDINPDKIKVIYNGIEDLNEIKFNAESLKKLKEKNATNSKKVILFVGRVNDPRKGLNFLLKAFKEVKQSSNVVLIVIGKGNNEKSLKLCKKLGIEDDVIFKGFLDRSELLNYYKLCDLYVCPSKLEGFGLTILEAMMVQKPIVATRVGAIPEILENYPLKSLVNPGDLNSLADSIVHLLDDPNQIDTNLRPINKKFSWHNTVEQLDLVYKKILKVGYFDQ